MNKEQVINYISENGYTSLITNHRDAQVLRLALDYLKNEDPLLTVSENRRKSLREYYMELLDFHINEIVYYEKKAKP